MDIGGTDAGISRLAPASLALGNGTAGDFTGSLKLTGINNQGGMIQKVNVQSGNYSLLASDYVVSFSATATATLNSALTVGTSYRIKFTGIGTLTISPTAGTIDGQATAVIATTNQAVDVVLVSANVWQIF